MLAAVRMCFAELVVKVFYQFLKSKMCDCSSYSALETVLLQVIIYCVFCCIVL